MPRATFITMWHNHTCNADRMFFLKNVFPCRQLEWCLCGALLCLRRGSLLPTEIAPKGCAGSPAPTRDLVALIQLSESVAFQQLSHCSLNLPSTINLTNSLLQIWWEHSRLAICSDNWDPSYRNMSNTAVTHRPFFKFTNFIGWTLTDLGHLNTWVRNNLHQQLQHCLIHFDNSDFI